MNINRCLTDLLSDFAKTLATDFSLEEVLDQLVLRIVDVLPITSAALTLLPAGSRPRCLAASDHSAFRLETLQAEVGQGPTPATRDAGTAISIPDLAADERFPLFTERAIAEGSAATFAFPLRYEDRNFGALALHRTSPGPLNEMEMRTAQTLADVAAAYLLAARARSSSNAASERERRTASHDALTGLANRSLLVPRLDRAIGERALDDTMVAVLYANFDLFKSVNEQYGHDIGDELLVAVAKRLTDLLRPGDSLACVGGDEFVIVCSGFRDEGDVEPVAARLLAALAEPFVLTCADINVTASIGIAFAGTGTRIGEQVLDEAAMAMQQAKERGGNRHDSFDAALRARAVARADIIRELRVALDHDQFCLHYQPVVALDGSVQGLEALVRWQHPTRGLLPPSDFISIMEDTGLIVEMGAWTLDQACRDLAVWRTLPNRAQMTMAVNLSGRQLLEQGLSEAVAATLATHDIPPAALWLEMTESVLMDDSVLVTEALTAIHDLGVRLAVDDFGTGYSSLLYLRRFPVDALKLDRLFVAGIDRNAQDPAIVRAVIDLAHSLGLVAVAEGVETAEQLTALREMGCDLAQGFHWSRAVPAEEIGELLSRIALDPVPVETWSLAAPWPSPGGTRSAPTRRFHNLISVLIASSSPQEIGRLYAHLEATGAFRVVADATSTRTAVALTERTKPDLVVLDMAMPGMNGLQTIPFLLRASPTTRVVLLTDHVTDSLVDDAAAAGAAGVLQRGQSLSVIIEQLSVLATATPEEICISPEAWWVLGRSTIS